MNPSDLPGAPFLAYRDQQLFIEQLRLQDLAQQHGTPLFVYSKAGMLHALSAYQRAFAGRKAKVHYAMKANSSLGVLQVFAQAGCGFDIVSAGELARVLAAGARRECARPASSRCRSAGRAIRAARAQRLRGAR